MSTKNTKTKTIESILKWFKETLPSIALVGSWVFNYMMGKVQKEKLAHIKTKLEKDKLENEKKVVKDKSDVNSIMDAVSKGRKLRASKEEKRRLDATRKDTES